MCELCGIVFNMLTPPVSCRIRSLLTQNSAVEKNLIEQSIGQGSVLLGRAPTETRYLFRFQSANKRPFKC